MWFRAGKSGEYTIKASEIYTFDEETPIYILDIETSTIQNLREIADYTFDYTQGNDRSFLIYFSEPDNSLLSSEINIYSYENIINVNFPLTELANPSFSAEIMIFDLSGKQLFQQHTTQVKNEIVLNLSSNVYLVKTITYQQTTSKKLYIK
jgi:hypothetical protein